MDYKWESKLLHEHPAKHNAGRFGKIVLHDTGIYGLMIGGVHMSCPQHWAAKIHAQEQTDSEVNYILKGIDGELWHQAKVRATQERTTMKQVLLDALKKFVEGKDVEKC